MADAFTPAKGLILMQTGGDVGTWGANLNNDCISVLDNNLGGNTIISVAGGIDVTLSSSQAENFYYSFTGALTGNINVIWPTGAGFYIVANNTTGAFTLTIKPTGGTGIVIAQGSVQEVFISTNTGTAFLTNNVFAPIASPTFTGVPAAPTAAAATNTTQLATTEFVTAAITAVQSALYPVGSIYTNISVATNPATLLGFGTWTALAGVCLVGVGTGTDSNGYTQTFTAGTQVGEYVHTLTTSELAVHSHSVTDPGHIHHLPTYQSTGGASTLGTGNTTPEGNVFSDSAVTGITVANAGSGSAHNNVQPVIGAYMWRRTA